MKAGTCFARHLASYTARHFVTLVTGIAMRPINLPRTHLYRRSGPARVEEADETWWKGSCPCNVVVRTKGTDWLKSSSAYDADVSCQLIRGPSTPSG